MIKENEILEKLEYLWPRPQKLELREKFSAPQSVRLSGEMYYDQLPQDLIHVAHLEISPDSDYIIDIRLDMNMEMESYSLKVEPAGISLTGADLPGIAHGAQTLLQILALARYVTSSQMPVPDVKWPQVSIHDWPTYKKRGVMLDMGRSVFSVPLIKRIIRVLARLKMNLLHLHLYDNELCGLRFEGLPFGSENPYALSLADLAEIVQYAAQYHIEVMPELESWGHIGSLLYHRPELRGAENIDSFLIGDDSFALMKEMIRQVASVMTERATIHLGLDEASWFLHPAMPSNFTPKQMVRRYYDMVQEIGRELGKELTMQVWVDPICRLIPTDIQHNITLEPWQYFIREEPQMADSIANYSGAGKPSWMIGVGQSMHQHRGAYHANRYWCQQAVDSPNVAGVDVTLWGNNDLEQQLLSLFTGAYYAWNPHPNTRFANVDDYELYDQYVFPIINWWQGAFRDGFPDEIRRDRGPKVKLGLYLEGENRGQPIAPTVALSSRTYTGIWSNTCEAGAPAKLF